MTPILKKQLALLGVVLVSGGLVFRSWRFEIQTDRERSTCLLNLKQIAFGTMLYMQECDERFPPAAGWRDRIAAHAHEHPEEPPFYTCPSLSDPKGNGYALSDQVSARFMAEFASPQQTVQLYETTTLAHSVHGIGRNIAFRHRDGANFAFADGHVKWYRRDAVPSFEVKLNAKGSRPKRGSFPALVEQLTCNQEPAFFPIAVGTGPMGCPRSAASQGRSQLARPHLSITSYTPRP